MRMKSTLYAMGLVAAVAAVEANVAQAQSANITATANVASALTATAVQGLNFGTIIPTFTKTVLTTDAANAGVVKLAGGVGAGVNITLSGLASLTGPGTAIPVTYSAGTSATQTGTQASFTPASGTAGFLDATTGLLYVFVAGSVTPPSGQTAGTYTNTVTVSAVYNGN